MILAALGKSGWHVAPSLGISSDTVDQHVEMAKQRFGVASRAELVVRALFEARSVRASVVLPRQSPQLSPAAKTADKTAY